MSEDKRATLLQLARQNAARVREPPKRKNLQSELKEFNAEILCLMREGVPVGSILHGLKQVADFPISKTTLIRFMQSRYPEIYEKNYTARAPEKAVSAVMSKKGLRWSDDEPVRDAVEPRSRSSPPGSGTGKKVADVLQDAQPSESDLKQMIDDFRVHRDA